MNNLMHDYEVMSRVNELVGSLRGRYKDINTDITKKILTNIQSLVQKKDEEMAWVDSCCLQLVIRNKNGKDETFTFQTENPSVKKEWITELRLAQLALNTNNSPAWDLPDNEHRPPSTKMPLFVKTQCVNNSHHQTDVIFIPHNKQVKEPINYRFLFYFSTIRSDVVVITQQRTTIENQLTVLHVIKVMYGLVPRMEPVVI